jgi:hypothetical protein
MDPALKDAKIIIMDVEQRRLLLHQNVTVKNTDEKIKHMVVDRDNEGHLLEPGQSKMLDLLLVDIKYFVGRAPRHPIVIEGYRPDVDINDAAQQSVQQAVQQPQRPQQQPQQGRR